MLVAFDNWLINENTTTSSNIARGVFQTDLSSSEIEGKLILNSCNCSSFVI